ncbi:hypothetical protein V2J09_010517 [Rumex salicifolius]
MYVDDIIVTRSSTSAVCALVSDLATKFSLKDLGPLSYFLGVEVQPTSDGLFLSQRKYVFDLLVKAGMVGCKAASTPLASSVSLLKSGGHPLPSPTEYHALVGSLIYLSLAHPNVAYSTNKLSQFMQQPTAAGDKDDYVSMTGYIFYLGRMPISQSSRKQSSNACSSTEAEYKALADTALDVLWVLSLFDEVGHKVQEPPVHKEQICLESNSTIVAGDEVMVSPRLGGDPIITPPRKVDLSSSRKSRNCSLSRSYSSQLASSLG